MRTYKHLWDEFISDENIDLAIAGVCKHKTTKRQFKGLYEHPERYKEWIRKNALNFKNNKHKPKEIYDGVRRKKRTIIVPTFREQIIHHMAVNILKPIVMKPMYKHSYGSIPGRGAHLGKKYIQKAIAKGGRNIKYVLKMDIKKYFNSIPHDKLIERISRTIKDKKFLELLKEIIGATDTGIPLGFYTSQWFANWYLTDLDHYIKEELKAKYYFRYMDDMVIFGSSKRELHKMKNNIDKELKKLGLEMKDDWQVFRFNNNGKYRFLDFMGFRFYRNKVTLRRTLMYRAARKAKAMYKKDKPTIYDIRQMLSYMGWITHTDTYNAYSERIKPYVSYKKMVKRISNYDRRVKDGISNSSRNTRTKTA